MIKVGKKETNEGRSCNGGYSCDEEVTKQYHHDVFSMPKVSGPRRRSAFEGCPKVSASYSLRSEGRVDTTMATSPSSGAAVIRICYLKNEPVIGNTRPRGFA